MKGDERISRIENSVILNKQSIEHMQKQLDDWWDIYHTRFKPRESGRSYCNEYFVEYLSTEVLALWREVDRLKMKLARLVEMEEK